MNQDLIKYLQQQIRTTDDRVKRFTHNMSGDRYPRRFMFVKIQKYISDFLQKKSDSNLVIMPGFRGVGKTTLMAQMCSERMYVSRRLFLSVEDVKNLFNVGIAEIMMAYEQILGCDLESVQEPVLIFLDEIQTDPKWAASLKSLYERTSNVFFCCTGSSALELQTTPNLARRAVIEKMPPMCFVEYQMIKNNIYPTKDLKNAIRETLYFSDDVQSVYTQLLQIQPLIHQYWSHVNRADIREYLSFGTLPFAFMMPNESAVYNSISSLLDKIIKSDLPTLGSFDHETLGSTKRLLFAIAENDVTSLNTLEKHLGINRLTIANLLDALEMAELLIKVPAYGSNMSAAKKPNKYLFMSPAIRMSFFFFTGQESTYLTRQGKLLEDSVGAHLYREFVMRDDGAMRYDSAQGGADFILQIANKKQIIIEVGMGKKDKKQILNSAKKINSDYNIIISDGDLGIDEEKKIIFLPLDHYFLM